jgi:hypothetical protein
MGKVRRQSKKWIQSRQRFKYEKAQYILGAVTSFIRLEHGTGRGEQQEMTVNKDSN